MDESDIHDLAMKLLDLGVDIEQEQDAAGFLGVDLECDEETGILKMKQPVFIDLVISAVGLEDGMSKVKYTPSFSVPLVKNQDDVPVSGSLNYISVLGIRICLSGHTLPEIAFAFNVCARCMFFPKHFHEESLKPIVRYLKLIWDSGLILNPNRELFKIYSYPDPDLSGMCGHEKPNDTACFKSLTGYVITFSYFPV